MSAWSLATSVFLRDALCSSGREFHTSRYLSFLFQLSFAMLEDLYLFVVCFLFDVQGEDYGASVADDVKCNIF